MGPLGSAAAPSQAAALTGTAPSDTGDRRATVPLLPSHWSPTTDRGGAINGPWRVWTKPLARRTLTRYVIWQGNCDVVAHTTRCNVAVLRMTKAIEYSIEANDISQQNHGLRPRPTNIQKGSLEAFISLPIHCCFSTLLFIDRKSTRLNSSHANISY